MDLPIKNGGSFHTYVGICWTYPTFAHRENFLEANDGRFGFGPQGDGIGLAHGALRWSKARRREHQLMRVHADTIRGHLIKFGKRKTSHSGKARNAQVHEGYLYIYICVYIYIYIHTYIPYHTISYHTMPYHTIPYHYITLHTYILYIYISILNARRFPWI